MDWNQYLNREIRCACGKTHQCGIGDIVIKEGALCEIPGLIRKGNYSNLCIVQDTNTKKAAGDAVCALLDQAGIPYTAVTLAAEGLLPDERGIGSALTRIPAGCGLIIAVGSGTLNDICRFISYKLGIDYFIAGTAPSMDGFTSNVAAMITDHAKTTYEAHMPQAFIGDLSVLAKAPMDLIAAGVGDVIGKYVCLTDWKLSHLITGEYFCEYVEGLVRQSIEKVTLAAGGIKSRDPQAIAGLTEGLVLSGIAMSYIGNSRPASGSEHHLSHYWEMMFLQHGEHGAWHGAKVGIGTVAALRLYHMFEQDPPAFVKNSVRQFDKEAWAARMRTAYGQAAPSVIALEERVGKNSGTAVAARLDALESRLPEVLETVSRLPEAERIKELLASLDAPFLPSMIGVPEEMFCDSILYAKELRNRFGLLQILYDTGKAEEFADRLTKELYYAEG